MFLSGIEYILETENISDAITIGTKELEYIREISLIRAIVPELEDAICRGRPNLVSASLDTSSHPSRKRSTSTSSTTSTSSETGDTPPSSPDTKLSARVKRLRRLSVRRHAHDEHDYDEKKVQALHKEILFPKAYGCPCAVEAKDRTIKHIEQVIAKASGLAKPTAAIRCLVAQAELVIQIRTTLRHLYTVEQNEEGAEPDQNEKDVNVAVEQLHALVDRFSTLSPEIVAGPVLHDVYVARCELKFRNSLLELKNSEWLGVHVVVVVVVVVVVDFFVVVGELYFVHIN